MVLVTALLLLVVVTLLAVGMFRSFGLDEKIAGNVREKQRALNAAETAEQYAEWWLSTGHSSTGITCAAATSGISSLNPQICSTATGLTPTQVMTLPWTARVNYDTGPSSMLSTTANGQANFANLPAFSIAYLGTNTTAMVYQIDAVGYGGSADTSAIVEATYAISASTQCKSCGQ
jgi:type IV pilus assembly protein PilX